MTWGLTTLELKRGSAEVTRRRGGEEMISAIMKRLARGEKGFTLIELLIVIVIIAILMAVAIPAFLGQRQKAQDSAAKSTLRNGMTAMETFFVDNQTYVGADAAGVMEGVESSYLWTVGGNGDAAAKPQAEIGITAAKLTGTNYELKCLSASGNQFTATRDGGITP